MNDILYKFKENGMIYNYADDNTIYARDPNQQILKKDYYKVVWGKLYESKSF